MASHTMEQYHSLMPYIVRAMHIKGQFASDPILFKAVKSWLFLFNMTEEFNNEEYDAVHDMFWSCVNILLTDGKMPKEMIEQSKVAVNDCGQVDITLSGDIMDLAIEMWEDER